MLMHIPKILSPELVKLLMEMGHGDEIVLADGNFPAAGNAKRLVRCDAAEMPALLEAILQLFPVDTYTPTPIGLMAVVPGDTCVPTIWQQYQEIIEKYAPNRSKVEMLERHEFYQRARQAYAIVATGEQAQYANIILRKGVVL